MHKRQALRVAIDAQIVPWRNGGVVQALMSLIRALGQLQDGDEDYRVVVGSDEEIAFWQPLLGPNQKLAITAAYFERIARERALKEEAERIARERALKEEAERIARERERIARERERKTVRGNLKRCIRPMVAWLRSLDQPISVEILPSPIEDKEIQIPVKEVLHWPEVPISDGFYESLGCDVLHFPWQHFVVCSIPTIFNPHDLQHLYYPQFFTCPEIVWKETIYPAGCKFAQTIVVGSQWAKDDLIKQYRIDSNKVQVIPEGSPTELSSNPSERALFEVKKKYNLPEEFIFYPAITWPHKNHIKLLEALAYLRDTRGLNVPLVCVGAPHERFWPCVEQRIDELGLKSQINCLGFVPEEDFRAIFRLAQCLVFPSLFEASSLPIFEAWLDGVPVACSDVTALPSQVLDAALLFDPNSVESIAHAVARMVTERKLRQDLREFGYRRLKDFSWDRTAKAYRAVYRRAAGFSLTEEDHWLLSWDWMRNPKVSCPT
jgi:glycosyltransferase involved in cell wall biosynthesis